MFKKIFVGCICGMLLWNILSNSTGEITSFAMPEKNIHKDISSETNTEDAIIALNKISLDCDFFPLNGYELEKVKIEGITQELKAECIQITEDIEKTIDELK